MAKLLEFGIKNANLATLQLKQTDIAEVKP